MTSKYNPDVNKSEKMDQSKRSALIQFDKKQNQTQKFLLHVAHKVYLTSKKLYGKKIWLRKYPEVIGGEP